jgi:membrane protein YdbS with pleckstrin-like domain
MPYRTIDAILVLQTLEKLRLRIGERFPKAGLGNVCAELALLATDTQTRVTELAKPMIWIRAGVGLVLVAGAGLAAYGIHTIGFRSGETEMLSLVSALESAVNLLLVVGAGVFSLTSLEARLKRHTAMGALHELRSIIHVIDMHQLTKDPVMFGAKRTKASPDHKLSPFELVRYLDYCSEMLSLSGKLAALYAQDFNDPDVIEAASDIEQLATNLSQKVWQKITIVQASGTTLSALPSLD